MENVFVFIVIISFAAIGVLLALNRRYTARRILQRWCKRRDYILKKKKRIFWGLILFSNAMKYEITVVEKDHNLKSGEVKIGSCLFGLSTGTVRVKWH